MSEELVKEITVIVSKKQHELLSKYSFEIFEVSNAHMLRGLITETNLTVFDMVQYFNGNYEVLKESSDLLKEHIESITSNELDDYNLGYLKGISYALNLYGITVEGLVLNFE